MENETTMVFSFTLEEIRGGMKNSDPSRFGVVCENKAFTLGEQAAEGLDFIPLSQIEERVTRSGLSVYPANEIHFVAYMIGDTAGAWAVLDHKRFKKVVLDTMIGPSDNFH